MTTSIKAVPSTWHTAPSAAQLSDMAVIPGSDCPVSPSAASRNSSAKGSPKMKRTWVAPNVPIVLVSPACAPLRKT